MYMDVFFMLIGFVLMWRLHLYSGQLANSSAQARVDWLLLLSPLVLLLGAATVLLRVLPIVLRLLSNLANQGRGLILALTLHQVSHNPTQVILLVLLLTLATSLAVLSTGLNATLGVSEMERAQYVTGSDARFITNVSPNILNLENEPEVEDATAIFREKGTVDIGSFRSYPRFEVLAIDAEKIKEMGNFRDDFADRPMQELLNLLVEKKEISSRLVQLPGKPDILGLWLWSLLDRNFTSKRYWHPLRGNSDLDRIQLKAKLQDSTGEFMTVQLGQQVLTDCPLSCCNECAHDSSFLEPEKRDTGEWRYFYAILSDLPAYRYPLSFHSLWFECIAKSQDGEPAYIDYQFVLDDLAVIEDGVDEVQVVDSFDHPNRKWYTDVPGLLSQENIVSSNRLEGNFLSLIVHRNYEHKPIALKIFDSTSEQNKYSETALPALSSSAFFQATQLNANQTATAWVASLPTVNFLLVGKLNYFPTLYEDFSADNSSPREAGFLVTSRDALLMQLNDRTPKSINANEVWLSTNRDLISERLVSLLPVVEKAWKLESVHLAIKADPMALGIRSVIFYGSLTTSLLSIVGFTTNFYVTARRREAIYAILRTIGMSLWQLYTMLFLEQLILVLSGFLLGTLLGTLLNKVVLPGLPVALGELPPTPPFSSTRD
jgi:hypothetical protein